jgi:hypothetical protein
MRAYHCQANTGQFILLDIRKQSSKCTIHYNTGCTGQAINTIY